MESHARPQVVPLRSTAPPGERCGGFGGKIGVAGLGVGVSAGYKAKWRWGGLTAGERDEPLLHHERGHGATALQHGHHLVVGAVPAERRRPRKGPKG